VFPVLVLTGPRQVVKTTLLRHLGDGKRNYVTLDDPDARRLAQSDPAMFLQRYTPPVTIDEIQYAPEILPFIKMSVDASQRRGDFWLTGSQAFHTINQPRRKRTRYGCLGKEFDSGFETSNPSHTKKNVSESLAGRAGIMHLLGLSSSEIAGIGSQPFTTDPKRLMSRLNVTPKVAPKYIWEQIFSGGMPGLLTNPNIEMFFSSYISTYLQRDIRSLAQVADEMAFFNFMVCVAARTATPINFDDLARDAGISAPTAKKWLSVLVSSHIVTLVQAYSNNALKRIVKMPLLHFLDTGLCAYLLKWNSAEVLEVGAMSGAFFESWVFSQIYKSWLNAGKEPPIFYYRDKDKREIDILLVENGKLYPIEIKKAASPGKDSVKNFKALQPVAEPERFGILEQHKLEVGCGAVVCMANDLIPIDQKNWCVPAWLI
jgi:predicted AAA+ superfamily ATPase